MSHTHVYTHLDDFLAHVMPSHGTGRIMGLDVGKKRIGYAMSDIMWRFATPSGVIVRTTFSAVLESLRQSIQRDAVAGCVVGWPLAQDGSSTRQTQSVRHFAHNLAMHTELPILMWDERYSTHAANRMLLESDISRVKRAQAVDAVAAAFILNGVLMAIDFLSGP